MGGPRDDVNGMTTVRVVVGEDAVLPLYQWLAADPDVQHNTTLSFGNPQQGDMGALDVINVVLSNTIAFSGLVVAIASWRDSRRGAPGVEIEKDGVRVSVADGSPETIRAVIDALSEERG